MSDLSSLLARLDPHADTAQRHLWLIDLFDWLRGDGSAPQAPVGRIELLLNAIEGRRELLERMRAWWTTFVRAVDITTLLADHGFAPRTAFLSELQLPALWWSVAAIPLIGALNVSMSFYCAFRRSRPTRFFVPAR